MKFRSQFMNLIKPLVLALVLFAFGAGDLLAQQPRSPRFSLRPELLDLPACVAQPGNVPIPLTTTNANLEVLNWMTAPSSSNAPGEFLMKFATPTALGSMLAYEPGAVRFSTGSNVWKALSIPRESARKMQVLPFPPGALVEAIKFTVPARRSEIGRDEAYHAVLPFVIFIPIRAINIAPEAKVTVSSTAKAGPEAKERPWLNKIETLTDGFVDVRRNFSTGVSTNKTLTNGVEWIMLSWEEKQPIRGFVFLNGDEEKGAATCDVVGFVAEGEPIPSNNFTEWQPVGLRTPMPSKFRGTQFAVVAHEFEARGVRLVAVNQPPSITIGEIMALQDLGTNAVPPLKLKSARPAEKKPEPAAK